MNKVMFIGSDPNTVYHHATLKEYTDIKGGQNKAKIQLDHDLKKGHDAVVVWYDGKVNPFLASMNTGQIYLRGHGNPGIETVEIARGGEKVHYTELVKRLIASGLKPAFGGAIKCYHCHSAEPGEGKSGKTDPLAQLVADELYALGYKSCTFYGYVGSIDSHVKEGSLGLHKYVRGKFGIGELGRASDSREEFKPRVRPKKSFFAPLTNLFSKKWL